MDTIQSFVLAFTCRRIFHSLNVFVDCSVATFERGEHNLRSILPPFSTTSFLSLWNQCFVYSDCTSSCMCACVNECMHRWQACHIFVNGFFCIVNRTAEASWEVMTSFIHVDNNNYVYVRDRRVCVRANEISGCAKKPNYIYCKRTWVSVCKWIYSLCFKLVMDL